jgi:hypothetical protein
MFILHDIFTATEGWMIQEYLSQGKKIKDDVSLAFPLNLFLLSYISSLLSLFMQSWFDARLGRLSSGNAYLCHFILRYQVALFFLKPHYNYFSGHSVFAIFLLIITALIV